MTNSLLQRDIDEINAIIQHLQQTPSDASDIPRRIELCHRALELVSKRDNEQLWAAMQGELGDALSRFSLGDRAENLEQAIYHSKQALTVYTQDDFASQWAQTKNDLANAYLDRIAGSRRDNLEQAIHHCQEALNVYTYARFPIEWAMLQNTLARAYANRISGSRSENLEQAIHHYHQALEVRTREAFPADWSITHNNLGNVYANRISGSRSENLEQAIHHYQQALEVRTREDFPLDWAMTQNNLANAYSDRIAGSRSENLEQAIHHYQQALELRTRVGFPIDWAMTQNNLGNAFIKRIAGSRSDNLEQAIHHYQQALEVRTREDFPLDWALTQYNLATAYLYRVAGSLSDNLENVINHYGNALELITKETFPTEWAATQKNLAVAYYNRSWGDRAQNIESAIAAYQQALTVITQTDIPFEWAETLNDLGIAYQNRVRGDRAQNIESAIAAYQQALSVMTQTTMPLDWSRTMLNLATAYTIRIRGDRAQNLEDAIAAFHQVLTIVTQTAMPIKWAQTLSNLAVAYKDRIRGDRAQNLEDAIVALKQALTVIPRTTMSIEWAQTLGNLAVAYKERIRGDRAQNMEDAIAANQQALTIMVQSNMPLDWATTMMNLATAYTNRIRGDRAENIEDAIAAYHQALSVRTRTAFPVDHRDTLRNLVLLYFGEGRWAEAHQTCLDAIAVGADIFAVGVGDAGRMDAIKQTGDLYTRAAYSAVQLGRYGEALTLLEAGKARLLADAQSLTDANLSPLTDDEHQQVQNLRDAIKALEYEYRLPTDYPARRAEQVIVAELGERREALRGLIEAFRARYPGLMPEGLALAELLALIPPDGALVAPLFTDQGSAVFIVQGGVQEVTAEHVLRLADFKLADLSTITRGTDDNPGWLLHYVNYRFDGAGTQALFSGIEDVTRRLWDAVMGRVHERLQALGIRRVLLMPQSDTNLVPLHAAWREVDGSRRYFMDDFTVSYTPSMVTLATAKRKSAQGEGALVAGVSQYDQMLALPNTRAEAEAIAALLGSSPLLDSAASASAVKYGAAGKRYVHLSCHGGFGWGGDAFASALYLAHDEALSLPEIMAKFDLKAARLAVLSACETGIIDFNNVPDEFIGLPAGFMQAGASAVISSLWTVEDRSTSLLMEKMYKLMLDPDHPLEPAEALRQAQFWLRNATAQEIGDYYQSHLVPRMSQSAANDGFIDMMRRRNLDERPYEHPFYWAAFTYSGL